MSNNNPVGDRWCKICGHPHCTGHDDFCQVGRLTMPDRTSVANPGFIRCPHCKEYLHKGWHHTFHECNPQDLTTQLNLGWQCPKCRRCYSPVMAMCVHCPSSIETTSHSAIQDVAIDESNDNLARYTSSDEYGLYVDTVNEINRVVDALAAREITVEQAIEKLRKWGR